MARVAVVAVETVSAQAFDSMLHDRVPIYVDRHLRGVYIIKVADEWGHGLRLIGGVSAYGGIMGENLVQAYQPGRAR